ncbi:MAG: pseudouridine synthase [Prolixibacteraceae bacterium]|jgi:tRNA pseudouridine65 synthase|nr:pseudouridine synthase [Prolixibacteraceae bacterium]
MELEVLYHDEHLIAINKPHGLLVHRSFIAADVTEFAIQILRDQIGQRVTPVHRLDRKTSGVLLFALSNEANRSMNIQFQENKVVKKYLAVVRGYTIDEESIDYPLKKENGQMQEAISNYKTLERVELDIVLGKHPTQRYSLVEVKPDTGRMHQIRRHMDHIRHPIIGDRPHGCNKQNKLFRERWEMMTMLLHANSIRFHHPITNEEIEIKAKLQPEYIRSLKFLGFTSVL